MAAKKPAEPSKTITAQSLRQAQRALNVAVQEWNADPDAPVVNGRRAFSEKLQNEFERLINATADTVHHEGQTITRPIDPNAYEMALLWDQVAIEYRKFKQLCCSVINLEELDPNGHIQLWRAVDALNQQVNTEGNFPPPMPIASYRQSGVGDEQIARIYGWFLEGTREADITKVAEEFATPGTHYNPDTWVHPGKKNRVDAAIAAWANRLPRSGDYDDPTAPKVKSAPPSLQELVSLGAPPAQIANLHGISESEAMALLLDAGKPIISSASDVVNSQQSMAETAAQAGAQA